MVRLTKTNEDPTIQHHHEIVATSHNPLYCLDLVIYMFRLSLFKGQDFIGALSFCTIPDYLHLRYNLQKTITYALFDVHSTI